MPDHRDTMEALARENGWRRGVELGLGHGLLFARFLALGIEMVGVDLGLRPERRKAVEALGGGTVHWTASAKAAPLVPDGWADFVFIDAGHSKQAVEQDIRAWLPKVREGGWFGGHDFHPKFPGVMLAATQAFGVVKILPNHIWVRPC